MDLMVQVVCVVLRNIFVSVQSRGRSGPGSRLSSGQLQCYVETHNDSQAKSMWKLQFSQTIFTMKALTIIRFFQVHPHG